MKTVAIDYDDTYTLAPSLWNGLIGIMHSYGWKIVIVTYRHSTQFQDMIKDIPHISDTIFTGGIAKQTYCENIGLNIDVWIDDSPEAIIYDYENLPIR